MGVRVRIGVARGVGVRVRVGVARGVGVRVREGSGGRALTLALSSSPSPNDALRAATTSLVLMP